MYVYERMNKNPDFVRTDDKISDVCKFMSESEDNICVVDGDGIFVGIIENEKNNNMIDYLPKKTKVIDITQTGSFRINQDKTIEEAAFIVKENRLDFLPVVDNNNLLVGTVTKTALFSTFMKMLSINGDSKRLIVSAQNDNDFIPDIAEKGKKNGCRINSILSYSNNGNEIIISYSASDEESSAFIKDVEKTDGLSVKCFF